MNNLAERLTALSTQQRALLEKRLLSRTANSMQLQTIPRRVKDGDCPLSIDQERLWFISQLEPESPAYNLTTAFRIGGNLHAPVLDRSFNEVIRRHEILRTTFPAKDGLPYQRVAPDLLITIPRVDLRNLSEVRREEALSQIIREQSYQPFDLTEGPLLRCTLVEFGETDYAIITTLHHIITDWWSFDLLWSELTAIYQAFSKSNPSPLPGLPIQFSDFAVWQRRQLQGEGLESRLSYWRKQLAGADFILDLPSDRPRPAIQTYHGKRQYLKPPQYLWDGLKTICQKEKASLYMALLATFYTLLYRYTGREDIIVGSPYANRNMFETEKLIGYFLNTLVLRADLSGDPTFRELLCQVREVTLGAYNNNDVPLVKLIQQFQPDRDLSRNPLFQVSYVFTNSWGSVFERSDLTFSSIEIDSGLARFDLTLAIRNGEVNPLLIFEYNTDLFDDSAISRMMSNFQTLLEGVVANADQRLNDLPLFTDVELRPRASQTPPWRRGRERSKTGG
jgi:aspartate racemase